MEKERGIYYMPPDKIKKATPNLYFKVELRNKNTESEEKLIILNINKKSLPKFLESMSDIYYIRIMQHSYRSEYPEETEINKGE